MVFAATSMWTLVRASCPAGICGSGSCFWKNCSHRRRVTRFSPNSWRRSSLCVDREIPDLRVQLALGILDESIFARRERFHRPDPEEQIAFLLLEGFDLVELLVHHAVIFQLEDGYVFHHAQVLFRRQLDDINAFIIGKP